MEEWIGQHWHRFVTAQADGTHADAAVSLAEMQRPIALLLHAAGGQARVAPAAPVAVGGERTLWQRLAGAGRRAPLGQLDAEVLALPERLAVHADAGLNRDLYLWLAALAAHLDPRDGDWLQANLAATQRTLAALPGLRARWQRLREAELALRPTATELGPERAVQAALRALRATAPVDPRDVAPVWCWLRPCAGALWSGAADAADEAGGAPPPHPPGARVTTLRQRRRVQHQDGEAARAPLLLAPKSEWLKTFTDPFPIDRAQDDHDDGDAATAAEELDALTLQRQPGPSLAARVRFDLDLPAASADDLPVGEGEWLSEWDPRRQTLVPRRVLAQAMAARDPVPWQPAPALRAQAARLRRRLALQQAAPRWLRGQRDGEALDLDACVRHLSHPVGVAAVYQRPVRAQRELASLLLADLSLSTDAHANDQQRVIDVIRDALFTFGEALSGSGDAFAMLGFSSVRRQLRLHALKGFDERWGAGVHARLGALKPGYYTRMGAALRAATLRLQQRPERQRLLILLTDGKPHDLDGYEGRLGQEDTRQAVQEARAAGLLPFAVSIDETAPEALPQLFGSQGWAWVRRPDELPARLATLYGQLTR
ncbi:nitric oxide reductase activation protein NorD [Inhella crocodyli]|uniref:VWA domain-containing protein n=1 Tax=Inhella crocodyli TaxID=2499851 RepID=A0A437LTK5_9BURK|nr:VWA domain-containing protein [Inhella crocodyli]RVT88707.1 VWA domain-containing protein [Inhella crocodyli]